jgi:hypothetical protein
MRNLFESVIDVGSGLLLATLQDIQQKHIKKLEKINLLI